MIFLFPLKRKTAQAARLLLSVLTQKVNKEVKA